jgi:integrase
MIALQWKDIDLEHNFIKVSKNIGVIQDEQKDRKVFIQDGTKTRKSRIVHLTTSAYKYITQLYDSRTPKSNDYVVQITGERDYSGLRKAYNSICEKAGIDNHQGLHTLRHTFASLMIRKGVDIKIISEMLGHSSVSFTYNTYVHLIEEEKAKIIQQIDV